MLLPFLLDMVRERNNKVMRKPGEGNENQDSRGKIRWFGEHGDTPHSKVKN